MSRDGKNLYVANYGAGSVSQFDVGAGGRLSPKAPATVVTGQLPSGVAVSPDGKSVYVTNYGHLSSSVSQFDVGAGGRLSPKTPSTIGGIETPAGIAVTPDGKTSTSPTSAPGTTGSRSSTWEPAAACRRRRPRRS